MFAQRLSSHYLLPTLPYLAMASGACLHTSLQLFLNHWNRTQTWLWPANFFAILFLVAVIIYGITHLGSYSNKEYETVIKGVDRLGKQHLISNQGITTCKKLREDWRLIAYAYRMHRIWLTKSETEYFLSDHSCDVDNNRYQKVDTLFFNYNLYKKSNELLLN